MTPVCDDDGIDPAPRDLRERLRVVALEPGHIVVAADRISACAACSSQKGCGTKALASMSRATDLRIARPPGLDIAVGDDVEVTMPGNSLLAGAGLAYLVPALCFITALSAASGAGLSDAVAAAVAVMALALSFLPLVWVERRKTLVDRVQVLAVHPAGGAVRCGP